MLERANINKMYRRINRIKTVVKKTFEGREATLRRMLRWFNAIGNIRCIGRGERPAVQSREGIDDVISASNEFIGTSERQDECLLEGTSLLLELTALQR